MSDNTGHDTTTTNKPTPQRDYTLPIARAGEQQFAAIVRQRSGMDAGCIDMAVRDISHLSDADKRDAVESAYSLYESWRDSAGIKARRDKSPD